MPSELPGLRGRYVIGISVDEYGGSTPVSGKVKISSSLGSSSRDAASRLDVAGSSFGCEPCTSRSVYVDGSAPSLRTTNGSVWPSPRTTPAKSSAFDGGAIVSTTFLHSARTGMVMRPVWHMSGRSNSTSLSSLGVKHRLSGALTPADIRPGGVCVSSKNERTSSGSGSCRNMLNVYETFVSMKRRLYVSPTVKSLNSSTPGLARKGAPTHSLPPTTCFTKRLVRCRSRASAMYRVSSTLSCRPPSCLRSLPSSPSTSHSPSVSAATISSTTSPRSCASAAIACTDDDLGAGSEPPTTPAALLLRECSSLSAASAAASGSPNVSATCGYLRAIMSMMSGSLPRPSPNFQSLIVVCFDGWRFLICEVGSSTVECDLVTLRMKLSSRCCAPMLVTASAAASAACLWRRSSSRRLFSCSPCLSIRCCIAAMLSASCRSIRCFSIRSRACSSRSRKTWYGLPPAARMVIFSDSCARSSARRFSYFRSLAVFTLACAASVDAFSCSTAAARFSISLRCASWMSASCSVTSLVRALSVAIAFLWPARAALSCFSATVSRSCCAAAARARDAAAASASRCAASRSCCARCGAETRAVLACFASTGSSAESALSACCWSSIAESSASCTARASFSVAPCFSCCASISAPTRSHSSSCSC